MGIFTLNNHEHIHIPIPKIILDKTKNNIAQVPGTNNCIICGDNIPDSKIVLDMYNKFLETENANAKSQNV